VLLAAGCAAIAGGVVTARSDTLEWALVLAYQNNPSLNAQRAALRATEVADNIIDATFRRERLKESETWFSRFP